MGTQDRDAANVQEILELVTEVLRTDDMLAATIKYDLHAIAQGRETLNQYDMVTWARLKSALSRVTGEELTELIGPPTVSGEML